MANIFDGSEDTLSVEEICKRVVSFDNYLSELPKKQECSISEKKELVDVSNFIEKIKENSPSVFNIFNTRKVEEDDTLDKINYYFEKKRYDIVIDLAKRLKTTDKIAWLIKVYNCNVKESLQGMIVADKACEAMGVFIPYDFLFKRFEELLNSNNDQTEIENDMVIISKMFKDNTDRSTAVVNCMRDVINSNLEGNMKYTKIKILSFVFQITSFDQKSGNQQGGGNKKKKK